MEIPSFPSRSHEVRQIASEELSKLIHQGLKDKGSYTEYMKGVNRRLLGEPQKQESKSRPLPMTESRTEDIPQAPSNAGLARLRALRQSLLVAPTGRAEEERPHIPSFKKPMKQSTDTRSMVTPLAPKAAPEARQPTSPVILCSESRTSSALDQPRLESSQLAVEDDQIRTEDREPGPALAAIESTEVAAEREAAPVWSEPGLHAALALSFEQEVAESEAESTDEDSVASAPLVQWSHSPSEATAPLESPRVIEQYSDARLPSTWTARPMTALPTRRAPEAQDLQGPPTRHSAPPVGVDLSGLSLMRLKELTGHY